MSSSEKTRLTKSHVERIAAIQAVREWLPLAQSFPAPGQHVWVKMEDGLIEIAHWDSARASWTHSPFERWGRPEFWAPIAPVVPVQAPQPEENPFRVLPISGTAPSRVRPERGPALFPFKFLTSLLQ